METIVLTLEQQIHLNILNVYIKQLIKRIKKLQSQYKSDKTQYYGDETVRLRELSEKEINTLVDEKIRLQKFRTCLKYNKI